MANTTLTMSNSNAVTTFADSTAFLVSYVEIYVLVITAMIIMSIIRGKQVTLCYQCYTFLKHVTKSLTNIQIVLNCSQEKHDMKLLSETNAQYIESDKKIQEKRKKLSFLTYSQVSKFIDDEMLVIHGLVDNIGNILKHEAKKWFDETQDENDKQQEKIKAIQNTEKGKEEQEEKKQELVKEMKTMETEQTTKTIIITKTEQELTDYLQVRTNNIDNGNSNTNTNNEYLSALINEKIIKQGSIKKIFLSLWDLKGLLWTGTAHYFDTATDIALIWEWYLIYKSGIYDNDDNDDNGPSMYTLWICALLTTIYYRLTSMYYVWKFTRSIKEGIFQFVFDHYLIKMIYVNLFEMNSTKPLQLIKLIRGFEGGHESAFQSVLSLVFLFKINFQGNYAGVLTLISFIFSFLSLINRFISLDYYNIDLKARDFTPSGINIDFVDVYKPSRWKILCKYKINGWYIFHWFFRCVDVSKNVLFLVLLWVYQGGDIVLYVIVINVISYIGFDYLYSRVSSLPTDWFRRLLATQIVYENLLAPIFNCALLCFQIYFMILVLLNDDDFVWSLVWFVICVISVVCLMIARKNYKIWDDIHNTWFVPVAVVNKSNIEMELNLSDFIDMKNKDCILFSKYLIGDIVFANNNNNNNINNNMLKLICCDVNASLKSSIKLKWCGNTQNIDEVYLQWGKNYILSILLCGDNEIYSMMQDWYYEYNNNSNSRSNEIFEEYLIKNVDNQTIISVICHFARFRSNVNNIYKMLCIDRNIFINFNDVDNVKGGTILHWVCYYPNYFMVKWIIDNKIVSNVNQEAKRLNKTALCWLMNGLRKNKNLKVKEDIINCQERKIAKLLINAGANQTGAKHVLEKSRRAKAGGWYQLLTGQNEP